MLKAAALKAVAANAISEKGEEKKLKIKFKSDTIDKSVPCTTFERNGWVKTEGDDWMVGWFTVGTIRTMFHPDTAVRLLDNQMVNHFPNYYELCSKDKMAQNIKRFMRDTKDGADGAGVDATTGTGAYTVKDGYIPLTYNLPADYNIFLEEFKRNPSGLWIMKPRNGLQGKGIFIVSKLAQIKKWREANKRGGEGAPAYIVSQYINNPLLIGGRKFDLRLYILVTSYRPLRVYQYLHGFARFCITKYSSSLAELDNPFIHLTNVAIQKNNEDYNSAHGGKWHIKDLRLFLEGTRGTEATDMLFAKINRLIIHSLLSCQDVIINERHCFECYGYDLLIDDDLKPWLVEVNASPSLSASTPADRTMKLNLIRDVYRVVVPQDAAGWAEWRGAVHSGPMVDVSNFVVLYDEAVATAGDGDDDGGGGGGGGGGRQAQHPPAIRKGGAAAEEDDDGDDEIPSSLLGR